MWRDEHTGLYHTHYRLYDPQHVRWLTPDPAGYRDGQNLYRFYAGPNGVDVLGLDEEIRGYVNFLLQHDKSGAVDRWDDTYYVQEKYKDKIIHELAAKKGITVFEALLQQINYKEKVRLYNEQVGLSEENKQTMDFLIVGALTITPIPGDEVLVATWLTRSLYYGVKSSTANQIVNGIRGDKVSFEDWAKDSATNTLICVSFEGVFYVIGKGGAKLISLKAKKVAEKSFDELTHDVVLMSSAKETLEKVEIEYLRTQSIEYVNQYLKAARFRYKDYDCSEYAKQMTEIFGKIGKGKELTVYGPGEHYAFQFRGIISDGTADINFLKFMSEAQKIKYGDSIKSGIFTVAEHEALMMELFKTGVKK